MTDQCENLDAFLAGDLSPDGAKCFESHLDRCDRCREAVDQQCWIDDLLRSPLRLELERGSPALSESIRDSIRLRRQKTRFIACGLAAAAAVVIAAGWTALLNRQARGLIGRDVAAIETSAHKRSPSPSVKGRGDSESRPAVFIGNEDLIVVPVASRHRNVTVVRVYPTYRPSDLAQTSTDESGAGEREGWPARFNGG